MNVRNFAKDELLQRACERVAYVMKGMLEERGTSDTRLLGPPLVADELVFVGRSGEGATYREHVIPRLVICKEAHSRLQSGTSLQEVGAFIAAHLKIVHLTKDECDRLNKKVQCNLRQRMPEGWSFGKDLYARLHQAEIEFTPVIK